jgi:hypothetical protein
VCWSRAMRRGRAVRVGGASRTFPAAHTPRRITSSGRLMRSSEGDLIPALLALVLSACGSTALRPNARGSDSGASGCTCPTDDSPVCGDDGRSYVNTCEAGCAGARVVHEGACAAGVSSDITLKIVVPAGRAYCDQPIGCSLPEHFHVLSASGQEVPISRPACLMMCSSACDGQPCPAADCVEPDGVEFTGAQIDWNGDFYYAMSKCGMDGTCYEVGHLVPGQYVARLCGTPGTLAPGVGGSPSRCAANGPTVCVDVPFSFPGSGVVAGQLP